MKQLFLISSAVICVLLACKKDNEETPVVETPAPVCTDTTTYTFTEHIQDLLITNCSNSGCHNASSNQSGLNVHSYTSVKNSINKTSSNFLARVRGDQGVNKMPPSGAGLKGFQINTLTCWIEKGMKE